MADYADAVQGVQQQTAAFELLARVHIKDALSTLSGDEQGILLDLLRNTLEPRRVMYFSSASKELRALLTPAAQQQLRADYEEATALCLKVGLRGCKELREATEIDWGRKGLSAADLSTLGKLGAVLPALKTLDLAEPNGSADPDGVQRLAEGLVAGALPALTRLGIYLMHMGDAGASAIAAALDRGAMPRLEVLALVGRGPQSHAALAALGPALRRLPTLKSLCLTDSPFGDEGLAALVAPPSPAAGTPPPTGGLKKLELLDLSRTQITDAGCATLVAALDSGALPALEGVGLDRIPARKAAIDAVYAALARSTAATTAQLLTVGAMNSMNDNTFMGTTPTLQLLDVKKIYPTNPHSMAPDRYRIIISDGTQLMQAMLATNLNFLMDSGQLQKFSIVRVDEFLCNTVQGRRIIILLNLTPIQACNKQIGYPVRSSILTG